MSLGPAASFLSEVIEPPPPKAVTASLQALSDVGAITLGVAPTPDAPGPALAPLAAATTPAAPDAGGAADGGGAAAEALTPLGRHLALLPLEPRLGKLLVMGACLGCLAPALVGWGSRPAGAGGEGSPTPGFCSAAPPRVLSRRGGA
jgi:HrpA-like RNA helicase